MQSIEMFQQQTKLLNSRITRVSRNESLKLKTVKGFFDYYYYYVYARKRTHLYIPMATLSSLLLFTLKLDK